MAMMNDIKVVDSTGEIVTYAPPKTAARYLIETQPDGQYTLSQRADWSLKVELRGGALHPVGYSGDLEAIRAAFPDIDPEAN